MPSDPSYLAAYREAVETHGCDFLATLWASERTQRVRFRLFTEMCYLPGKRILDAGCSRGDFASYLLEQRIDYAHFVGLDAFSEVIDFAKTRNLAKAQFLSGDFVTHTDLLHTGDPQVITFSGSLNTMTLDTVLNVLEAAWAATSQTLIFNFLSNTAAPQAPQQTGPANRLDTLHLLNWAMQQTPQVAFRQDYFPYGHDATICMDKDSAS